MIELKYITNYSKEIKDQVEILIKSKKLGDYLKNKYPKVHNYTTSKLLYDYVLQIKNKYLKKAKPISRVVYDDKIKDLDSVLGTHTFVSRIQGGKLKAKNEIRIASLFKKAPEEFLHMIVVHELAHFKEKDHNKAFYRLCEYLDNDYHQLELDLRLFLIYQDSFGDLY